MIDNMPYAAWKYRQISKEFIMIMKLSEGAISYSDIDNMPLADRHYILKELIELKEKEIESYNKK